MRKASISRTRALRSRHVASRTENGDVGAAWLEKTCYDQKPALTSLKWISAETLCVWARQGRRLLPWPSIVLRWPVPLLQRSAIRLLLLNLLVCWTLSVVTTSSLAEVSSSAVDVTNSRPQKSTDGRAPAPEDGDRPSRKPPAEPTSPPQLAWPWSATRPSDGADDGNSPETLRGLQSMLKLFERSATGLAEEGNTEETPFNNTTRQVDREFLNQILLSTMQAWCQEQYSYLDEQRDEGQIYCNSTFDRVLCWPTTPAGEVAIQPCPPEFAGFKYLKYGNASKICYPNGTWELKTDYNQCHPEFGLSDPANIHNYVVRWLFYVGFTVSILSCVVALFIFLYFKALQCVRNKIHCHLIVTFVLRNLLWLIMNNTFPIFIQDDANYIHQVICKGIVTLFNYAQVTNFFWMLVEGLYLHLMIVWAFSIEMIKFWWYIVLGWCTPALIVLVWVIVKLRLQNNSCWLPEKNSSSDYEYIYIAPVLLVLVVNVIFLISIIVVLITKLRATNTVLARQYKIAVKATVILLPLLGGTYVLFICSPGEEKLVSNLIFIYFNTILQSTQGLAVTTFYCFLNGEVRATIQNRYVRWREGRTVSTRYTRGSMATSNGETLGLQTNFRIVNGISNGRTTDMTLKTVTADKNHPEHIAESLIDRRRDGDKPQTDDSDNEIEDSVERHCRDITLL